MRGPESGTAKGAGAAEYDDQGEEMLGIVHQQEDLATAPCLEHRVRRLVARGAETELAGQQDVQVRPIGHRGLVKPHAAGPVRRSERGHEFRHQPRFCRLRLGR